MHPLDEVGVAILTPINLRTTQFRSAGDGVSGS
jgi:hypothetical protein